jgi:hypothetical protein
VPKESKKFINPLLRPSQEPEVKGEPAARPQKNLAPEPFFVETSVLPEAVNDAPVEVAQKEAPSELPVSEAHLSSPTKTSTLTETSTSIKVSANTPSASSPVQPETLARDEKSEEKEDTHVSSLSSPELVTPELDTPSVDQQEEILLPDPVVTASPLRQNGTIVESDDHPLTYTETETSTPAAVLSQPAPKPRSSALSSTRSARGEKKPRASFTAAETVRRRRGALTFENTHERITLWIDKELKVAFEELAYERELPKTALLNEAVSDLLKKYDLQ